MSVITQTTRGIAMNGVLQKYMRNVPKHCALRIFTDQNCLSLFNDLRHENLSFSMFLGSNGKPCDYIYIKNLKLNDMKTTVKIHYLNDENNMVSHVWNYFSKNREDYGIVASSNTKFERILNELNAKNSLYFNIEEYAKRSDFLSSMNAQQLEANMWRIFSC